MSRRSNALGPDQQEEGFSGRSREARRTRIACARGRCRLARSCASSADELSAETMEIGLARSRVGPVSASDTRPPA